MEKRIEEKNSHDRSTIYSMKLVNGYVIPKDKVDKYDGRELALKIRHDEISSGYES